MLCLATKVGVVVGRRRRSPRPRSGSSPPRIPRSRRRCRRSGTRRSRSRAARAGSPEVATRTLGIEHRARRSSLAERHGVRGVRQGRHLDARRRRPPVVGEAPTWLPTITLFVTFVIRVTSAVLARRVAIGDVEALHAIVGDREQPLVVHEATARLSARLGRLRGASDHRTRRRSRRSERPSCTRRSSRWRRSRSSSRGRGSFRSRPSTLKASVNAIPVLRERAPVTAEVHSIEHARRLGDRSRRRARRSGCLRRCPDRTRARSGAVAAGSM